MENEEAKTLNNTEDSQNGTTQPENTSEAQNTVQQVQAQPESPASQTNDAPETNSKKQKKKKNFFVRLISGILWIVLGLIVIIGLWMGFSALDKKKSISMIPQGYSVYVHTDSVYEFLNPLLDLQAADIFLSGPDKSELRGIVMQLRESDLRDNAIVKFVASRKIDIAVYSEENNLSSFVASVNLGFLSSITRLADLVLPHITIENLSMISTNGIVYYSYKAGDMIVYFKPVKNLVIASNNLNSFLTAINGNNDKAYNETQLEILNRKVSDPVKIVINAQKLAAAATENNEMLSGFANLLNPNALSLLTFSINAREITFNVEVPVDVNNDYINDSNLRNTASLLSNVSTSPAIISRMSNTVQYYTLLNIGTLEELKDALFPIIPADKDIYSLWNTGNGVSKALLNTTLDDLLFSWSGKELAVLGIEGLNDPVFAIQISNESKRKEVFDSVFSSFLIKENKSLILNGVRIPRIELPSFLTKLLGVFGISLPKPYYLVYNNYIFFSQSAETLSNIYSSFGSGSNISHNPNYKMVSLNRNPETGISLFYDLERSRPFFINSNSSLSQILELYTIGKVDLTIKKDMITFHLNAASKKAGSLKNIPGFPMKLDGEHTAQAYNAPVSKPTTIFWVENNQLVKALDAKKTKVSSYALPAKVKYYKAVASKQGKEQLMAVTENNEVYLLSSSLELERSYPVKLPEDTINFPYLNGTTSYIPMTDGSISKITGKNVAKLYFDIKDFNEAKTSVYYNGTCGIIYEKGFLGKMYVIYKDACINKDDPLIINKIGFGVPAIFEAADNLLYAGCISQSGELEIYKIQNGSIDLSYTSTLDGVFYTNLTAHNGFFYALSGDGQIYKINIVTGDTISIQLDNVSTKENGIYIQNVGNHSYICVGIDGNMIYAFSEDLELMPGFPVAGNGIPAFADVNGDGSPDCFALTIDGKINAWNLR